MLTKITEAVSRRIKDLCIEQSLTVDIVISGNNEIIKVTVMESICDTFGIALKEFFECDLFAQF